MADPSLIADLARAGLEPELLQRAIAEVSKAQSTIDALGRRRSSESSRSQRYRDNGGGSIPAALRAAVYRRDGFRCVYCDAVGEPLHCDHIVPATQGGATTFENLATSCEACNCAKGGRTPQQWGGPWQ